jgi:excisionase family DNA binding protein
MTIPQVAEYLQLSKSKVYYLVSQKKIPHIRIQRNVRIFESDLISWMEKNKEE